MSKFIRINDEQYEKLQKHADADRRSAQMELEIILDFYFDDAEGGLGSEQVKEKRKEEAKTVRKHIVDEGKSLGILEEPTYAEPEEVA
jgi:hypothetical protein